MVRSTYPGRIQLAGIDLLQDLEGRVSIRDDSGRTTRLDATQTAELVQLATRLASPERRQGFRVPLTQLPDDASPLAVVLRAAGRRTSVYPLDLGLHGIRVGVVDPAFAPDEATVVLRYGDTSLALDGLLTRRRGQELTYRFGHAWGNEPVALARMHRELERRWLRSRPRHDAPDAHNRGRSSG
jgi:hypothetical protein